MDLTIMDGMRLGIGIVLVNILIWVGAVCLLTVLKGPSFAIAAAIEKITGK